MLTRTTSLRVAHLPSSYLPEAVGGTEIYVQSLCRELAGAGHRAAVVLHSGPSDGAGPEGAEEVVRLPEYPPRRRVSLYTHRNGTRPPGFDEFLSAWEPDVVHFHALTLGAGSDHAAACTARSIPYVVTYHTPAMSCPRGTLLLNGVEPCDGRIEPRRCAACTLRARGFSGPVAALLARSPIPAGWLPDSPLTPRLALPSLLRQSRRSWEGFFHGASHIIACADFCADVLAANGIPRANISIVRQGLPGDDRERTLRLPLRTGRPLRIGYFGRINPTKGADLLPPLLRRLRESGTEAVGEWVGPLDGEDAWVRRLWTAGEGLARYAGVKRGGELRDWIVSQDLIVLPSRWLETGPLTLLEAWDAGTPVIGTDRGGIRDFMTANGLGVCLHAPEDIESMAAAVGRLVDWEGRPPVVRVPGFRALATRMTDVYHRAIREKPARQPVGGVP